MPGGDRTGPMGAGPMTGRAMGYCTGYNAPGYMNAPYGRGMGRAGYFGRGRGRGGGGFGYRNRFYATGLPLWARGFPSQEYVNPTPVDEKEELVYMAKQMKAELEEIQKRIDQLEKTEPGK